MAEQEKPRGRSRKGIADAARAERTQRGAAGGVGLGLRFEEGVGIEVPYQEGALEVKLNGPTECDGFVVRSDGTRIAKTFLVEKFHLRIVMPSRPVGGAGGKRGRR